MPSSICLPPAASAPERTVRKPSRSVSPCAKDWPGSSKPSTATTAGTTSASLILIITPSICVFAGLIGPVDSAAEIEKPAADGIIASGQRRTSLHY